MPLNVREKLANEYELLATRIRGLIDELNRKHSDPVLTSREADYIMRKASQLQDKLDLLIEEGFAPCEDDGS